MIKSLRLVNFKNFADETLKVGPFTVIVGANASGKSNIRDAFRFLHGIGRGYNLAEILGGKYGAGGQLEWEPIRGTPNEIVRFQKTYPNESSTFTLCSELDFGEERASSLIKVEFDPTIGFVVSQEELNTESGTNYKTVDHRKVRSPKADQDHWVWRAHPPTSNAETGGFSRFKPALTQFIPDDLQSSLLAAFGRMRFLEFSPERMREPSIPGATMLGDSGENLPSVLEAICADSQRGRDLMSWFEELTPMDIKDFDFPRDPSGRVHLHIVERNGRKVSAYNASDGTLRFLGILAALFSPNEGGLYFFEEIDSGIHPARLWLLLDFIERKTAKSGVQVITTTHSPALLAWIRDEAFENTSVVYRDEYWADSVIRPIAGLYNLRELRTSQGLGRLFTGGWFETAMKCSEGDPDTDHLDDDEDDWEQGILE